MSTSLSSSGVFPPLTMTNALRPAGQQDQFGILDQVFMGRARPVEPEINLQSEIAQPNMGVLLHSERLVLDE